MASEAPKATTPAAPPDAPFPAFAPFPPPGPPGQYPYMQFPPAAQEQPDASQPPQTPAVPAAYMIFHPPQGMVYYNPPQNGASSSNSPIPASDLPLAPANAQTAALRPKRKQVKMA
ncbi:hypothetical protein H0H87_002296, partial [Tephrocybe sp. NHM501043]